MNPSVPFVRVHALPLLTIVIFGLIILPPLPAHAAEKRFVGDVVVNSGAVEHGVSTGAGNVVVHGLVRDDVRSGLGDVYVKGEVEGDIDAGLGDVKIEGPVDGDVHSGLGDVYINAPVKGDVDVGRGDVTLGPRAKVDGDLRFGSGKFTGDEDAVEGAIIASDFHESDGPDILGFVGWIFAALAFAACTVLAAVLAPRPLAAAARRAEESPGRSFVYGLVSLPAFFLLSVVLAVSIVGIPLLLLLAPAYLALLFCGALVAAFFLGSRVLLITGRYRVGNALAAVVGALILAATTLIPVLGDLLLYALALLGTGAAILALFSRRRPRSTYPSYEDYVRDRAGG
jgi:cytoskeletal protein CcmA (bactofilin family)